MVATILCGYLQQFFKVSAVLFLGVSWGTQVLVGCFYKVVDHLVTSCIQLVLLCWCFPGDILFLGVAVFQGIFQWLMLTFIYHYIYIIIHFCLVFVTCLGLLQLPHAYITVVSGFVFLDLLDMSLSINVLFIILLSFTLKIFFPQDCNLLFEINCKNCKKYLMVLRQM